MEIKSDLRSYVCTHCFEPVYERTHSLHIYSGYTPKTICMKCVEEIHDMFEQHHQEQNFKTPQQLELDLE